MSDEAPADLSSVVAELRAELAALRSKLNGSSDENDAPLFSAQSSASPFAVSKLNVEQFARAQPEVRDAAGARRRTALTWHLHYFDCFCVDHWPLLELEAAVPSDVSGLRVPLYERSLTVPLPLPPDLDDVGLAALFKRPGAAAAAAVAARLNACWNCGSTEHAAHSCPAPRDDRVIAANRAFFRAHSQASDSAAGGSNERYYERASKHDAFKQFSPGSWSPALRAALNVADNDVPEFVWRMRALGGFGPTYKSLVGTEREVRMPGINAELPPNARPPFVPTSAPSSRYDPYQASAAAAAAVAQRRSYDRGRFDYRSDYGRDLRSELSRSREYDRSRETDRSRDYQPRRDQNERPPDDGAKRARISLPDDKGHS